MPRLALRFSTQTLLLQLGVVVLVVLLSGTVHAWLVYGRIGTEAENQALTLARTVASDPAMRSQVEAISKEQGTPPATVLSAGPIQAAAEAARNRTGALFVVVTDETGLRLAHPDVVRLGERVSTDPSDALSGKEVTTRNTGTLGASAGAKIPVFAPGSTTTVVGEVSVGYSMESLGQSLAEDIVPIALTAAGSLLVGVLASFLLRRRLQRLTLGLEPEEISTLVHDQVAVLQGVDDGVIGISADGRITVFNAAARRLLGMPEGSETPGSPTAAGTDWERSPVPSQLKALTQPSAHDAEAVEIVAGGRVLVANARKALHRKEDLGWVVMLRDRTELQQLTRQLDAVGTMSAALRGPAPRIREPAPHDRRLHEHRPTRPGQGLSRQDLRHRAAEISRAASRAPPGSVFAGVRRREKRGGGRARGGIADRPGDPGAGARHRTAGRHHGAWQPDRQCRQRRRRRLFDATLGRA
nr:PAS domain-containing protein [Arthrobacter sp. efr-133-R2A-63]